MNGLVVWMMPARNEISLHQFQLEKVAGKAAAIDSLVGEFAT
jgi:hypothetical protein